MLRVALALAASMTLATGLSAAPCKDAKTGRFTRCAPPAAAAGTRCKDAKGKFAKCGTPGATPIAKK